MDLQAVLTARFINAIRKSFKPCPLVGPKWFKFNPDGKPADFQFLGVDKLAQATKRKPQAIADLIIKNLDLREVQADINITDAMNINVRLKKPADEAK